VLTAPKKVVDERKATLTVTWTTSDGAPVAGVVVVRRSSDKGATWTGRARLHTGEDGTATLRVEPRVDTWWRAAGQETTTPSGVVAEATSAVRKIDNVPPHKPVVLPAGAPKPKPLAPQRRAVGTGANPYVQKIPNAVWHEMVGVSWHAGCPVGRAGLRLLHINYWGFDGYRHRGEMVAAVGAVGKLARAFTALYRHQYPIRSMRLVDDFGYSRRTGGGNDYASMRHDNTSAFDCRWVDGRPGALSPHAMGTSVDINPWENPYGSVPNTWWRSHAAPRVTFRRSADPLVRLLRRHGLIWAYETSDSQHFDIR
jgi:hypothetical protein